MKKVVDWLQKRKEQRKIQDQEKLIEALKRPEDYRKKPAMKFASNRTRGTGPG